MRPPTKTYPSKKRGFVLCVCVTCCITSDESNYKLKFNFCSVGAFYLSFVKHSRT